MLNRKTVTLTLVLVLLVSSLSACAAGAGMNPPSRDITISVDDALAAQNAGMSGLMAGKVELTEGQFSSFLTTLALQDLKDPDIGQGAGLNNMMRQLGGSFGIAILTTLIHVRSGQVRTSLIEKINPYNPAYIQRNAAAVQNFMSKGHSAIDAQDMANRAIEGTVTKQTLLITYDNLYLTIGIFVLVCIPIVYLQKFKKNVAMPVDAH